MERSCGNFSRLSMCEDMTTGAAGTDSCQLHIFILETTERSCGNFSSFGICEDMTTGAAGTDSCQVAAPNIFTSKRTISYIFILETTEHSWQLLVFQDHGAFMWQFSSFGMCEDMTPGAAGTDSCQVAAPNIFTSKRTISYIFILETTEHSWQLVVFQYV
ncbi:hypothetical protein J6590_083666 [Homalodisca vitripennis]|nr:hypothetical protein J6590_083666 [Homalodisca vitripennis]